MYARSATCRTVSLHEIRLNLNQELDMIKGGVLVTLFHKIRSEVRHNCYVDSGAKLERRCIIAASREREAR